jgi:hypothetical protein
MDLDALKKSEERKREAAYDPVQRWRHIQQTITWAEANLPPHLRRNRPRIPNPGTALNSPQPYTPTDASQQGGSGGLAQAP